jgi:Flp pilus assembly protein TadG
MTSRIRRRHRFSDDRGLVGVAACMLIVLVLAGGALIFDGGRLLVAKREIINVAEGAARDATATADRGGLQERPAVAAARAHIAAAGVPSADIVSITVTPNRVTVTLRAHRTGVFTSLLGNETLTVTGTGTALSSYNP